jgi:hypothetical protein
VGPRTGSDERVAAAVDELHAQAERAQQERRRVKAAAELADLLPTPVELAALADR